MFQYTFSQRGKLVPSIVARKPCAMFQQVSLPRLRDFVFNLLKSQVLSSLTASLSWMLQRPIVRLVFCLRISFDAMQPRAVLLSREDLPRTGYRDHHSVSQPAPRWSSAFSATEGAHSSHRDDGQRGPVRTVPVTRTVLHLNEGTSP